MEIALGKNQVLWIKKQSVKGTAVWPSASDAVLLTGDVGVKQDRVFNADKQKRLTVSRLGRVSGIYKGGEFSFPTYIKPGGSAGALPVPAAMLESLLGVQAISTGSKVTYTLSDIDDDLVYLTILAKDNFETWLLSDVVVSKGVFKFLAGESDEAVFSGDFSGVFLASKYAGTSTLSAQEAQAQTTLSVTNPERFEVGQKVIVGTSGVTAGHLIESIDVAGGTITIAATGLESLQASGAVVKGWTPSITEAGELIHGRFGQMTEDLGSGAANVLIKEATLTIDNGHKVLNDEKTDSAFPSTIVRGNERMVTVDLTRYFTSDGTKYRYDANNQIDRALMLPAANGALSGATGHRVKFSMPNVQFDTPEKGGDAERTVSLKGHAFATAALNDELKIEFD